MKHKMIKYSFISTLIAIGIIFILSGGCKKNDDNPTDVTVTDVDGNVYHTVTIGTQVWMVENLKVTKYRDGTVIPNVTDSAAWSGLSSGAYCNYDNNAFISASCGRLYNWFAMKDNHSLCPSGWHVPLKDEWNKLDLFVGSAGGKLKATGTDYWHSPNTGATNSTGFTALPGGIRDYTGHYCVLGYYGYWWTADDELSDYPYCEVMLHINEMAVLASLEKESGLSVRCIKD